MGEPRVWTLRNGGLTSLAAIALEGQPKVDASEAVKVVEAEPFAELLEELIDAARYAPDYFIEKWGIDKTVETAAALVATLRAGDPIDKAKTER